MGDCLRRRLNIFRETRGSQIAEAALVMPIVFLLFLGIFWFGRAFNIYATINHAAREAARQAATNSCALCGNVGYSTAANADPIAMVVGQALMASKLDPALVQPVTPNVCACGTPSCQSSVPCATVSSGQPNICVQFNVQLNPVATTPGSCGVSVAFRYPYQFYLYSPFTYFSPQQSYLSTQVEAKGEQ
ncbi:MAG TPA: TadE family protein [Terriglobales bacterium]|nr:TadE family protein [Terriglobales bacterium]